jgi:hypothetical protein
MADGRDVIDAAIVDNLASLRLDCRSGNGRILNARLTVRIVGAGETEQCSIRAAKPGCCHGKGSQFLNSVMNKSRFLFH